MLIDNFYLIMIILEQQEGKTTDRIPLKQDMNMDRIENDILNTFNKNPYTQSLSSY